LVVSAANADTVVPATPSPDNGHALAQRFCTNCHLVEDNSSATVPAGVPTFRGIANKPGQTGQNIMNVLIHPHPPMPDIHLSRAEIVDIISYLESLRTNADVPPLLTPFPAAPKPPPSEHS
jgi:mono/diheme cytochrome c family protein